MASSSVNRFKQFAHKTLVKRRGMQMLRSRAEVFLANLLYQLQLVRLRLERAVGRMLRLGARYRIMATACWSFPIYSQTFVYQELTQLIRRGYDVRFIYSRLDREQPMPSQFSRLWRARRRLILHPSVCERSYAYFLKRMPEKMSALVDMLCRASGMTPQELRSHHHFLQAFSFARMVEAYRPDYLHSYFFYEGTLFALVASYLLNIPRGVSCYADHMLEDYLLKVVPLHLRQCSVVIATSERIKRELRIIAPEVDPDRVIVKPNAINAAQFPVVRRREPEEGGPFRLVCVSRIEPKKGLVYLVEAVRHLRDENVNVELHLIGGVDDSASSKDYARELEAQIGELNLGGIVHLEGRKSESEINRFFNLSQIFIAPFVETEYGDKDGVPTSLLEAMAAGLPIVATDAGSICEVIEDGRDGLLVAQRDSKALAIAIADLINNLKRRARLGDNAARKIRKEFDVTTCEHIFHAHLSELLASRRQVNRRLAAKGKARKKPLVSVIVIFYNGQRFIEEAIDSVLLQTCDDWELLLVDDGSTDGSTEIARRYAEQYAGKVRYLEHEGHRNLGMSAARNLGIRNARGEYVAFLDADDIFLPQKLERQIAVLEDQPETGMVYGATQYGYSWTRNPEDIERDYKPDMRAESGKLFEPPDLLALNLGSSAILPCMCGLLVRRKVLEEIGGFEEGFRGLYEDQVFVAKVCARAPVFIQNECWDKYRQHKESACFIANQRGEEDKARLVYLNWLEEYLSGQAINDTRVSIALEDALWQYRNTEPTGKPEPVWSLSGRASELSRRPPGERGPAVGRLNGQSGTPENVQPVTLRRVTPISRNWGFDRGLPVDRYYIEQFLAARAGDIRGRVLEIEDNSYTRRFGGDSVTRSDVLHVVEGNPRATIVADLTCADHIPSDTFDCVVLTQTLHIIYDTRAALRTLHRILKPGGSLLATFPGITRISHEEWADSWYWGFTTASSRRLFAEVFSAANVEVRAHGNVLAAISFLHGLAVEDLRKEEVDYCDPDYEVLITVRAVKQ